MRVLVAPQEFKESLSAEEAAAAIARGIAAVRPGWTVERLPLSDGGPGFLAALARASGGRARPAAARDALGRPRAARVLELEGTRTCAVEASMADGLALIAPAERDAPRAGTEGVGDLVAAALARRPRRLIVGVGGSAASDGGAGMARALGARFLDVAGRDLPPGAAPLARLDRIVWTPPPALAGVETLAATDVTNPLLGPNGAAAVFGPQKGASPEQVAAIGAALRRYASVLERALGAGVAELPGAGAAGGLAGGLAAFLGARIVSGFEVAAEAAGLRARLRRAGVVVTGEGSFDAQSLGGKTTGRLLALAGAEGVPCVVLAGRATAAAGEARTLAEVEPDAARHMREAAPLLERLAARWAESAAG